MLKNTVIVIHHWINEHTLKPRSSAHLRTNLLSCSSEWALFAPPSSHLWPPASRGSRPAGPPADSQVGWPDCRLPDWGTEWRSEPTRARWPRRTEPRCVPEYLQERRHTSGYNTTTLSRIFEDAHNILQFLSTKTCLDFECEAMQLLVKTTTTNKDDTMSEKHPTLPKHLTGDFCLGKHHSHKKKKVKLLLFMNMFICLLCFCLNKDWINTFFSKPLYIQCCWCYLEVVNIICVN